MQAETIIYHNPNCGTSRKVLGMPRDAGMEPKVIEYLKTPPSRTELLSLLERMGKTPRQILRARARHTMNSGSAIRPNPTTA